MRNLIRFFSYRSFIVGAVIVGLIGLYFAARDGLSVIDLTVLGLYIVACVALNLALRTPRAKTVVFDELAAFDQVIAAGRPTLLEFYSNECAACMANRPLLDNLEQRAGHRLQVLRVDAHDSIGQRLADRYKVTFTPTFILFNPNGRKEEEFVYVVNRGRVLYYLDQLNRS